MMGLLAKEDEQHFVLYSQKDSLDNYHLLKGDRNRSVNPYTVSRMIEIDIVEDEKSVFCKIYVGDRVLPSIRFAVKEVDPFRMNKRAETNPN